MRLWLLLTCTRRKSSRQALQNQYDGKTLFYFQKQPETLSAIAAAAVPLLLFHAALQFFRLAL